MDLGINVDVNLDQYEQILEYNFVEHSDLRNLECSHLQKQIRLNKVNVSSTRSGKLFKINTDSIIPLKPSVFLS